MRSVMAMRPVAPVAPRPPGRILALGRLRARVAVDSGNVRGWVQLLLRDAVSLTEHRGEDAALRLVPPRTLR